MLCIGETFFKRKQMMPSQYKDILSELSDAILDINTEYFMPDKSRFQFHIPSSVMNILQCTIVHIIYNIVL